MVHGLRHLKDTFWSILFNIWVYLAISLLRWTLDSCFLSELAPLCYVCYSSFSWVTSQLVSAMIWHTYHPRTRRIRRDLNRRLGSMVLAAGARWEVKVIHENKLTREQSEPQATCRIGRIKIVSSWTNIFIIKMSKLSTKRPRMYLLTCQSLKRDRFEKVEQNCMKFDEWLMDRVNEY